MSQYICCLEKYCDISVYHGDCSIKVADCYIGALQSFVINYASQFLVVAYSSAMSLNVVHYTNHKGQEMQEMLQLA